jgi:hypothetical protein
MPYIRAVDDTRSPVLRMATPMAPSALAAVMVAAAITT